MPEGKKKYRFFFMQPFTLPGRPKGLPKEETLRYYMYLNVKHLLEDVEWDLHEGPLAPYGDWPVENREEF